jgi:hypothetical protein
MKSIANTVKNKVIPQSFWFRLELRCRKLQTLGLGPDRGLDLDDRFDLPATAPLDGIKPWAKIRSAWNDHGLGFSIEVESDSLDRKLSDQLNVRSLAFWINTRDSRDVHRATRYCHLFSIDVKPKGEKSLDVKCVRKTMNVPVNSPPPPPSEPIDTVAFRYAEGYRVDVFLHADMIPGFDPETNRRLGFCYSAHDPTLPFQVLGVTSEFPFHQDPSLWSVLELVDD